MPNTHEPVSVEVAHKRFTTIVKLAALAGLVTAVVGGVGGYMVYQQATGGTPRVVILMPTIVCTVVTFLPIGLLRKRWFDSPEAIMAASKREPWPPQSAESDVETAEAA